MKDQTTTDEHPGAVARVKERVGDATEQVKETASHIADDARDTGEHLLDLGREKAHEIGDRGGEAARTRAETEKHRVASGLRTFADALRQGSEGLQGEQDQFRPLLSGAAERVERLSEIIESRDIDRLTDDARRFATEHQALFASGAFALGFLGARFLKSSEGDEPDYSRFERSFDQERIDRYDLSHPDSGSGYMREPSPRFGPDGEYDRDGGRRGGDYG